MTDAGQRSDPKFEIEDELDYLFANASPNPNREGCPSREELLALSRREKPIGDPDYLHLVRCSPCFREFRAIQQANKAPRASKLWAIPVAAVVVCAVAGVWMMRRGRSTTSASTKRSPGRALVDRFATLDLRPYAVPRGNNRKTETDPLCMPRDRVNATVLLPPGSGPGAYDVRILDQNLHVQAFVRASAADRNCITTLAMVIDLSALSAGDYQLALRRDDSEWQMFPLRLR